MRYEWMIRKYLAEATDEGSADGAPAGEEAGSHDDTDYGDIADAFERDSTESNEVAESGDTETEEEEGFEGQDGEAEADETDSEGTESDEEEVEQEGDDQDDDQEEVEEQTQLTEEEVQAQRQQYMESYAEKFKLSEEEIDELRTEPEKVLPKMLAKVHTETMEYVVNLMRHNLPQMVNQQLQVSKSNADVEEQFFGKFPELKNKKAVKTAERIARAYRQVNPDAPANEVIDQVGFMTWKQLGLPMDKLAERLGMGAMKEEVEKAPESGKGKRQGYTPESAGKMTQTPPKNPEGNNIFEEIADILNNDDL